MGLARRGDTGPVAALAGWRPLWAVALLGMVALAWPSVQRALDPAGGGAAAGGVTIDTSGATGTIENGRFRLDLPLALANRTDNMVLGIELWTSAWACPDRAAPVSRCRKLLSTGQEMALHVAPGGSVSAPTVLTGGVPPGAGERDAVRIDRWVENVFDDRDARREAAQAVLR